MSYEVSKQALMDKLGFNEEDLIMLFSVFIKSSKDNLERFRIAIEDDDYNTIYICSHSLKGSSGNLMLDDVYALSREVETASKDGIKIDYKSYYDKLNFIFNDMILK